jgi:hypothetical protein
LWRTRHQLDDSSDCCLLTLKKLDALPYIVGINFCGWKFSWLPNQTTKTMKISTPRAIWYMFNLAPKHSERLDGQQSLVNKVNWRHRVSGSVEPLFCLWFYTEPLVAKDALCNKTLTLRIGHSCGATYKRWSQRCTHCSWHRFWIT